MSSSSKPTQQIAILGGGIGGLACAAFLRKVGLASTVFEQAPELGEVGAGLVVAPNAMRLLRSLGVAETFSEQAVRLDVGWEFRRWQDGAVLSSEDLVGACHRLYGEETYTAHRADLLGAVRAAVPDNSIRLNKRCVEVSVKHGRPLLTFEGGETHSADIVIGADGIHSVVRGAIADEQPPVFSGMCAFRALVPASEAPDFARRQAQTLWLGPGRHLVHYPISAGRFVNIVAFAPAGTDVAESWSATATLDELMTEFGGWDTRLTALLRVAKDIGRWALLDRAPLPELSNGRLTLLGDAAHPMFPFFAQGAAQAIEDAAVLAQCLADDPSDAVRALQRYERIRLPRTTAIQELSRDRARANHLEDGSEQRARDMAFKDGDPLVANGWIYAYDVQEALSATDVAR